MIVNALLPAFVLVQRDKEVVSVLDKLGIRPHEGELAEFDRMVALDAERVRGDIMRLNLQTDV